MKIYCAYNEEFDIFLKKVVKSTIRKYGDKINFSTLQEIELVNKDIFSYSLDGKTLNEKKIIVTSRLYELLPYLDLRKLKNNAVYKTIVSTIIHELGHIEDMIAMPYLYNCVLHPTDNKEMLISLFWLEYLAEVKSESYGIAAKSELCSEFATSRWKINKSMKNSDYNDSNFVYLNKLLPYFIARTLDEKEREKYLKIMVNPLLKDYIKELEAEIAILKKQLPFDDVTVLYGLYEIMNKYYKLFMRV